MQQMPFIFLLNLHKINSRNKSLLCFPSRRAAPFTFFLFKYSFIAQSMNNVEAFYFFEINTEYIIGHGTGDHHRIVIIPSG